MFDQITIVGDKLKRRFYFLFCAVFCITDLTGASKPDESPKFSYKTHIDLNALQHEGNSRDIQFSMLLYNTKGRVIHSSGSLDQQFHQNAKRLDLFHYWDKKDSEKYLVAMTKVAYIINTAPSNINEKRLSNINYLKETIGDYDIEQIIPKKYKVAGTMFSPSFTYDLQFFRHPELPAAFVNGIQHTLQQDENLGSPFLTAVQHNYDYGKVLFHKTTKMSASITNYYAFGKDMTIVVVYSLSYLHNIPPDFIGGEQLMINEIKDMVRDFVIRTRTANESKEQKLTMAVE